nr:hypothetical protein GCM10020093_008810 [Planobispora longispora]
MDDTIEISESVTSETTQDYGVSLGFSNIVEIAGSFNYTIAESLTFSEKVTHPVKAPRGEFWETRLLAVWKFVRIYKGWKTDTHSCGSHLDSIVRWPHAYHICDYPEGSLPENYCRNWKYVLPSGGGGSGGSVNPPSSGPTPVTSVNGLADGTVLHTTDTRRIYKMVGGAPVWQATCADNICLPQSRPTTQAVVNAGPAIPRNGSSAVDQRGRVYVFVGGAPLWQDSCATPVNCGTPVKVSNWSIDARDHMNRVPADGNLVQAKAGAVDLPVAMTIGGALIPFASPQEVIDVGQGGDWQRRVVAISAGSYNLLGFSPVDGTLVQGTGGGVSGPVAMAVGGAFVPFANPQEVIDVGQGGDWASKVRAIPLRAFNAHPRVPSDSTLIQGTGGGASSPVATIVGGARVNFASPQEVVDSGYGADWPSKVRAIPLRAFNEIRDDMPIDGTLVQGQGTPVAAIVGRARVNFASPRRSSTAVTAPTGGRSSGSSPPGRSTRCRRRSLMGRGSGRRARPARAESSAARKSTSTAWPSWKPPDTARDRCRSSRPASGTRCRPDRRRHPHQGRRLLQPSRDRRRRESPVHQHGRTHPRRLRRQTHASHTRTRLGQPDDHHHRRHPHRQGRSHLRGGHRGQSPNRLPHHDRTPGSRLRRQTPPGHPPRVWDSLTTTIADGTRIKDADSSSQAAIVGGAKVPFISMDELTHAGYADKPMQVIPGRVWDNLTTTITDGTRIAKAAATSEAAIVGRARIDFHTMTELQAAGYGGKPRQVIPPRVWDNLTTTIADGTYVKSPGSAAVWLINGGRRTPASQSTGVQVIPARVLDAIPLA